MLNFDADCLVVDQKLSTIGQKVAMKSSTFWFYWNFTLDQSKESVNSYDCGYKDTTSNKLISLAKQTGSSGFAVANSLPPEYSDRVKAYANLTFSVKRLTFSDQRDYYCILFFNSVTPGGRTLDVTVQFAPAKLEVQGKFNFEAYIHKQTT